MVLMHDAACDSVWNFPRCYSAFLIAVLLLIRDIVVTALFEMYWDGLSLPTQFKTGPHAMWRSVCLCACACVCACMCACVWHTESASVSATSL